METGVAASRRHKTDTRKLRYGILGGLHCARLDHLACGARTDGGVFSAMGGQGRHGRAEYAPTGTG